MRELRRRLKKAFDEAGIEIPYPHTTLVTEGQKAAHGFVTRPDREDRPTV
jgi:small-conductance mechanosensitive channel